MFSTQTVFALKKVWCELEKKISMYSQNIKSVGKEKPPRQVEREI